MSPPSSACTASRKTLYWSSSIMTISSGSTERTVGAALRGRPAWNSISWHYSGPTERLSWNSISAITPGGHGGPPLQYVLRDRHFFACHKAKLVAHLGH